MRRLLLSHCNTYIGYTNPAHSAAIEVIWIAQLLQARTVDPFISNACVQTYVVHVSFANVWRKNAINLILYLSIIIARVYKQETQETVACSFVRLFA